MLTKKIAKNDESEYRELRKLWCDVFGDDSEYVDSVYDSLDAYGWVALSDDRAVSALTVFEIGCLDGRTVSCIYAVCTHPDYRSRGYARELIRTAVAAIEAEGKLAIVSPASESLVKYYANLEFCNNSYACGKSVCLYAEDGEIENVNYEPEITSDEEESIPEIELKLQAVDAATYGEYREQFLFEYNHIRLHNKFLEFIKEDSYAGQGMLLVNGGDAICVLNGCEGGELRLAELIVNPELARFSSEIDEQIATGMAELFEADKITYRMPVLEADHNCADHDTNTSNKLYIQSMLSGCDEEENIYFGFPMD